MTILIESTTYLGDIIISHLNARLTHLLDEAILPLDERRRLLDSLYSVTFHHTHSKASHQVILPEGDNSNVPVVITLMNSEEWELAEVRVLEKSFRT